MPAAGDIRAGGAFVELSTKDAEYQRGLRKAQQQLRQFGEGVRAIGLRFAVLGGAAVAGLATATRSFIHFGEQMHEIGARAGLTAQVMSELSYAAEQNGLEVEGLVTAMARLNRATAEAQSAGGETATTFGRLGISMEQLRGAKPEDVLTLVAQGMKNLGTAGERTQAAIALFGRSGAALLPVLSGGAAGLEALRQRARETGQTIDDQTAAAADRLGDSLAELRGGVRAISVSIGSALAPALKGAARSLTDMAAGAARFLAGHKELVRVSGELALATLAVGTAMVAFGGTATLVSSSIGALVKGYQALTVAARAAAAASGAAWIAALGPIATAIALVGAFVAGVVALGALLKSAAKIPRGGGAGAAPAEPPEVAEQRRAQEAQMAAQRADAAAKVRQLALQQLEDEHTRARALIYEKYDEEIRKAKEANADKATLALLEDARNLELHNLDAERARKEHERELEFNSEMRRAVIDRIQDPHRRELALINERFTLEAQLANFRGDEAGKRMAEERMQTALASERAAEEVRQAERRAEIARANIDQQRTIADLQLETQLKYKNLEEAKLELQRRRAVEEARKQGENVDLVNKEFDLRRRLLDLRSAPEIATMGTFSSQRLGSIFAGSNAQERTAQTSAEAARLLKRIVDLAEQNKLVFLPN